MIPFIETSRKYIVTKSRSGVTWRCEGGWWRCEGIAERQEETFRVIDMLFILIVVPSQLMHSIGTQQSVLEMCRLLPFIETVF